jgi:UDPglucose 6-dehydrogenase
MRLCVIGLGRLGLPWALLADVAGHDVCGLDVDQARVEAINRREIETPEPGVSALLSDPDCGLTATSDPELALADAELSVITVPTLSQAGGDFGLDAVLAAVETIGEHARVLAPRHVVVLKSTVSPGATSGPVRAALDGARERSSPAHAPGRIELVHAPEFHAIGSIVRDIAHPYLVILGGEDEWALARAQELHGSLAAEEVPVARLDATGAELAKLASNSFRTLKIAFSNSLAELCAAYDSDPRAVCEAVGADPHIGGGYLGPGMPYGGPCYPRDNPALSAAAARVGVPAPLPAAIESANERRFQELERTVLAAAPGPTEPIGILGIAFKQGVSELEGSSALTLARRLRDGGREVFVHDPLVTPASTPGLRAAPSIAALLDTCAAVLLATPDPCLVAELQAQLAARERSPAIVDPWGALSSVERTDAARCPLPSPDAAG